MYALDARAVSSMLQVPVYTVRVATREGTIPAGVWARVGRLVRYDEERLRAWLAAGGSAQVGDAPTTARAGKSKPRPGGGAA